MSKTGTSLCKDRCLAAARRTARYAMSMELGKVPYMQDLLFEGLLSLYDVTGDSAYLSFVDQCWERRKSAHGTQNTWMKNIHTCFYYEYYLRKRDKALLTDFVEMAAAYRKEIPRTAEGVILYYCQPQGTLIDLVQAYSVCMAVAGILSGDESFFEECVRQYELYRQELEDPETGLWHHASRWYEDVSLCPPGWGRGQGWVLRGMVDSLRCLPAGTACFQRMHAMLTAYAAALLRCQDEQGLWHQLVQEPSSYPETTGTGLIIYAYSKAIKYGWLDPARYAKAVLKGAEGLAAHVREDGAISHACCGTGPLRTLEEYRIRPYGTDHAAGPVLMGLSAPFIEAH